MFELCYRAEVIEPTVQTYRDKLLLLRKLDIAAIENHIPLGDDSFREVRHGLVTQN